MQFVPILGMVAPTQSIIVIAIYSTKRVAEVFNDSLTCGNTVWVLEMESFSSAIFHSLSEMHSFSTSF